MAEELYRPGLEGIIAGETSIATVEQDSLAYRGYRIEQLAEHSSFEESAYLLLHGELPTADELKSFKARLDEFRKLPAEVLATIKAIPRGAPGMDVLRTGVSMVGHFSPITGDSREALIDRATHVLAVVPSIIAARLRYLDGKEPVDPQPGLSHAAQTLYMSFAKEPGDLETRLLDLTLILYAEHEFNASTFAARVCTSTLSDLYSAIVAGIGTLKGPLHGGANEEAMKLIGRFKSAEEAKAWTEQAIENKTKIMGFGHRVYKNGDHRARILEPLMVDLAKQRGQQTLVDVYFAIKNTVFERKGIHMNVDYPCGPTYYLMGLPLDIYTPLFVASRVSGWSAHIIEQYLNNRIIRPRSRYVGPPLRDYVPIDKRG
ncbi:MAG: citrate synthase [Planctomycetota bacterium]|nr:MAG: citrate synthase [Planctomycetota bacterium]